jgi:hypothetical protein
MGFKEREDVWAFHRSNEDNIIAWMTKNCPSRTVI